MSDHASEDEPWRPSIPAEEYYALEELKLWSVRLRGVRMTTGYHPVNRCNPVVKDGCVYACTFAPGRLLAHDAETGKRRWALGLDAHGREAVIVEGNYVYAASSWCLFAIDRQSGRVRWTHDLGEYAGNAFYTEPVWASERIVWTDSRGTVYCLDTHSGQIIWRFAPKHIRHKNCVATPLVLRDRVIVQVSWWIVVALELETGTEIWRARLPKHPGFDIAERNGLAIVGTRQSLCALDPETGTVEWRRTWNRGEIRSLAVADKWMMLSIDNQYGVRTLPAGRKQPPSHTRLTVIDEAGSYELGYGKWGTARIRWSKETQLLYEAGFTGIGIVDPLRRKRLALIRDMQPDYAKISGLYDNRTTLPATVGDRLYFLSASDFLIAARNPVL